MNIYCSENCIHEDNGICTLTHITISSGKSKNNCPYYKGKTGNIESRMKSFQYKLE